MSEELEFENGLLSFANPNYQLDPADINSNLEAIEDFEDLYEELDTVCRYNRKSGIKSRRNYAQLDPESMGVKIDSETSQMLAADSDNNLKQTLNSSFSEKRYQKVDNDNTVIDSNDNEDVGRKSGFLDYYLSLEAASWPPKDPSPLLHNIQCSNTFSQLESSTAVQQQKELTVESEDGRNVQNIMSHFNNSIDDATSLSEKKNVSFRDQQMPSLCNIPCKHSTNHNNGKYVSHKDFKENDTLPSGWERHEDDSGPYYWHIGSGTIQREPPVICGSNDKIQSHSIKEIDMISSISDLSLHSCKSTSPILSVLSDARHVKPNPIAEGKLKRRSYPEGPRCPSSDKRPIRFAVRSLGWVEIAEDDLTPEKSSKAVNKCIVDLSMGRNDILDVVGRWGDGKDLFMDLDDYSLRLMSTQDLTILNTQPIHTIRVWGVGRDNGRTMDLKLKERVIIKFLAKEACAPKKIHNRLKNVYGDTVMDISNVRHWVKKFGSGETEIADKLRRGRSTTSVTNANRERADELIRRDIPVTVQNVADALNVSYGSAQGIIADLGYHKVCTKWVHKQLIVDNRQKRVEVCQELLNAFEAEQQDIFKNVVTEDETWAYLYNPESKVQSKVWRHSGFLCPKKFKSTRSAQKVMTTVKPM